MKVFLHIVCMVVGMLACFQGAFAMTDTIRLQRLDSVRVRAWKRSEAWLATVSVQKMDRADMLRQNIIDNTDGLRHFSGVLLRDYGGAGGMKTVSVRGLGAQHTAVSVDGIVQTDVQTGQVDFSRFNLMDMDTLKLVVGDECLLGQSARSAASASLVEISAVGNMHTGFQSQRMVKLEQGSFQRWGGGFGVKQQITPRWNLKANAQYLYVQNNYPYTLVNGLTQTCEIRENNRMSASNLDVASSWRLGKNEYLDARICWYGNQHHLPGRIIYYNADNQEKQHDKQLLAYVQWEKPLSKYWKLHVRGKWSWNECRYEDVDGIYPDGVWKENYWQRETYMSSVVQYAPPYKRWKCAYALDVFHNDLNSNQLTNGNVSRNSILQSFTVQKEWGRFKVNRKWLLSYYDNHAETEVDAKNYFKLNKSWSLSWQVLPKEELYIKGYYKNIFRMPTFTESYYYHLGNPQLNPERTSQYGVGAFWQTQFAAWWPLLKVSVEGYYNKVRDKITSIPLNLHQWRTLNVGRVNVRGIDVNLENRWLVSKEQMFVLHATATWQRVLDLSVYGSNTYRKQLAYVPLFTGTTSLAYENRWLNTALSVTGNSSQWGTHEHASSTRMSGFAVVTASVWKTLLQKHGMQLNAKFAVQNIGNKQYMLINGYPMPGRAYRLNIMFNF